MIKKIKWLLGLLPVIAALTILSASAASLPVEFDLANADLTVIGEENGDWFAYFGSPAGDMNGDGLGDFIIGAPMAGNKVCPYPDPNDCTGLPKGEGIAYLVLGRPENEFPASPWNLATADASFIGCDVNSMTARQLYTAGDVNGDGYDDIVISGWKCGSLFQGKTYLVLGKPEADWGLELPLDTQADAAFVGENEWDFSSYYTAGVGDVNGDGYDDFLISATHNDEGGDDAGQIYLILGKPEADWGLDFSLSNADATFWGEAVGDRIGRAMHGAGDVNGDGIDDFMIGSISSDDGAFNAGETYLILGREAADWGHDVRIDVAADASFIGEGESDESGRRMAIAGDVNGDGYDDMIIGGSKNDDVAPDAGKTYLILGKPEADWGADFPLSQADAIFLGEDKRDQAGRRISGVGDPNNDGYDDFLIGSPHNGRNGFDSGTAYLIYGKPEADWGTQFSLANADVLYLGKPDVGVAGYDVAWVNDFNGDSIDDFLISAYGGRNNDTVPGEAYIILGNDVPTLNILSPADGSEYDPGVLVAFEGTASDITDGDLSDQIVWTSDLQGVIGNGGYFETTTLSGGIHTITASVEDSGGFIVRDQFTVTILGDLPPEVTIISPPDRSFYNNGQAIQFTGTGIDYDDGDLSANLIWTSSIDGEFGTGADFVYAGLSPGVHEITARVTDSDNMTGSATVKLKVRENVPPDTISFSADYPEGPVLSYHRFVAIYGDKNGTADLDQVQLVMEPSPGSPLTLRVAYYQHTNELYLFDTVLNTWVGPCTPGERTTLTTSGVELDCNLTTGVQQGDFFLKLRVRARWIQSITESQTLNVLLKSTDIHNTNSGFVSYGTWILTPEIQ